MVEMNNNRTDDESNADRPKSFKPVEGFFDDSVIYVSTQNSSLKVSGGRLNVFVGGEKISSFPIDKIKTINIFGIVHVSNGLIQRCNESGITINYFKAFGKYIGSFYPEKSTIAIVRRKQASINDINSLEIAKQMIYAKIKNSRTFLARKKVDVPLRLKTLEKNVFSVTNPGKLRAIEGEAAGIYFNSLNDSLIKGWDFESRNRHPPKDHINSILSLSYTMIKNEVMRGLREYNLDPYIGVLHTDRHGRPGLALDLMEEFRPIFCDAFTIRLINKKMIVHDNFKNDNHLNEDALKKYFSAFDGFMKEEFVHPFFKYKISRRRSISLQSALLRKAIVGEMEHYHPLVFAR